MSPEGVSSLFPQRPIRPLPKRRLRERLSPEVADSIEYPPANQNTSPLFYYPNIVRDELPTSTGGQNGTNRGGVSYENSPRGSGVAGESDEEELALSSSKVVRRSHPEILNRASTMPPKPEYSRHPNPQPPPSTTSSADGYESFENTNNKKKRKIPTAGDSVLSGVHSLGEINSMGVSTATSPSNDNGDLAGSTLSSYYGAGSFVANNQGISGPGRGRFGRSRNGRSPLRALSVASSNWIGRGAKVRQPQWATSIVPSLFPFQSIPPYLPSTFPFFPRLHHPCFSLLSFTTVRRRQHQRCAANFRSPTGENHGIISSAIANAEKVPSTPGQENVSLLHQHSSSVKSSPTATQFTFTCDSPVPKPQWPGTDPTGVQPGYGPGGKAKHNSMAAQNPPDMASAHAGQTAAPSAKANAQPGASKKKSRRRAEKELRMAAKHRRQEAEYKYYNNPPKPEDMWICEFCEYERIFGEPPYALIRQYEIKDQKARHKEEERKRLLEKAKTKSRKGKKPAKSPGKAASPPNLSQDQGVNAPLAAAVSSSTHDDEYADDYPHDDEDFEESYSQEDPPMLLSDDPDGDQEHDCTCPTCGDCGGRDKDVDDPGDAVQ